MKDGGRCWREGRFLRKLALALAFQDEGQEGDRTEHGQRQGGRAQRGKASGSVCETAGRRLLV